VLRKQLPYNPDNVFTALTSAEHSHQVSHLQRTIVDPAGIDWKPPHPIAELSYRRTEHGPWQPMRGEDDHSSVSVHFEAAKAALRLRQQFADLHNSENAEAAQIRILKDDFDVAMFEETGTHLENVTIIVRMRPRRDVNIEYVPRGAYIKGKSRADLSWLELEGGDIRFIRIVLFNHERVWYWDMKMALRILAGLYLPSFNILRKEELARSSRLTSEGPRVRPSIPSKRRRSPGEAAKDDGPRRVLPAKPSRSPSESSEDVEKHLVFSHNERRRSLTTTR